MRVLGSRFLMFRIGYLYRLISNSDKILVKLGRRWNLCGNLDELLFP